VVHFVANHYPFVVFEDELPAENENNNYAALGIQAFISGDLAFFATILSKPNMSPVWCNWCMLSKQAWSVQGHDPGEKWPIEKLHQICHNVDVCGMKEEPSNVMGCVKRPLIDAVP